MEDPMEEKRRSPRMKEETLVRFEGSDFSIYSRATDVSERGAFLATHYLLDPGTRIHVSLIDPSGTEATVSAKVIRAMTQTNARGEMMIGLGVEFLPEDPAIVP
ncbi:MAG: PilZ domain-containing protein [Pseudomonadota bacterium]